ncbi:PREDICTED: segment polarity protein dishevelled homolog DVL-2 [Gekko japonicus]|uniref:Segment polarity protein dishevelled homolog DVL-2 n=1 Tax=Gekko japonicus TaxID=146911 RepID=A0ABM1KQ07_GEKJA|nr:PREDICTED: segment polarity protein dishevelled homolog DVL-2 [Gekko japonicus]
MALAAPSGPGAAPPAAAGETKVIYHLDEEETPYLVKIPVPADRITLGHVKAALARPGAKYFFKSMDQDFGVVKEEISDDNAKLPCFNGRVVSWLVSSETPQPEPLPPPPPIEVRPEPSPPPPPLPPLPVERTSGIGDSRPPSFHPNIAGSRENLDHETEPESVVSLRRERPRRRESMEQGGGHRLNGQSRLERHLAGYESSSTLLTSELETTSLCDSDDDDAMSRFSNSTEQSSASRLLKRHRRRRKQRPPRLERTSSFSSVTDSTMSLNIITVTLNMEKYNFLGISIVGQSNERGDGGIYIGSIMKGGAVAADGRIEPGDMLLQVNDINFENMSNDDAVRVLREIVHKPGPIVLTVAKCWDPSPQGYFTLPRNEPIQPIDPAAWVSHSAALTGAFAAYPGSSSMSTITSGTSVTETERESPHPAIGPREGGRRPRPSPATRLHAFPPSPGSDVVDWLYHHVEGFQDRREARKYASNLLKAGFIRHTVNKITFSEQCYYIFGDFSGCENYMANLSLNDNDGSSGASDQDTLAPLPLPGTTPWPLMPTFSYPYPAPHPYSTQPPPYHELSSYSYGIGSAGSQHSEGSRSSGSNRSDGGGGSGRGAGKHQEEKAGADSKSGSGSESEYSTRSGGPPGAPPVRDLGSVPPELTASRQSFHMAMGNPSEFFVDVM